METPKHDGHPGSGGHPAKCLDRVDRCPWSASHPVAGLSRIGKPPTNLRMFAARFRLPRHSRGHGGAAPALWVVLWGIAWASFRGLAVGTESRRLQGHVPAVVAQLVPKGGLPAAKRIQLAIGLAPRDEKGLDEFLSQVCSPGSPLYRHFLAPGEFAARFGPTEQDYARAIDHARRNGLRVTATHGNRLVLDVDGSADDIRRAFKVSVKLYRHPTEDRDFYAPDTEPTVDSDLPVKDISGLTDYARPRPRIIRSQPTGSVGGGVPRAGSGGGGAFFGKDFRAAYAPDVKLTGAGQKVGLLQFDGFYPADIEAYEAAAGIPEVELETVLVNGYDGIPTTGFGSGNDEVSLDIEMAIAMAPGLSKVVVFEAGPYGIPNDLLSTMASRAEIKQFGCSWAWSGGPSATTDNIFKQMAAQGQSFFLASGDAAAYTTGQLDSRSLVNTPTSSPYITVVGGTTLATAGPAGRWVSETVWNTGTGIGSGGGISTSYPLPAWQAGVATAANQGSASRRNVPDVAMVADNIHVRYGDGKSQVLGGTSCAAPLWAGLAALMNEQAAATGRLPVGFVNPALYAIGKDSRQAAAFHDVVTGNNFRPGSTTSFPATTGYDLCTGWGTPVGQALIDAVVGPPDALMLAPPTAFAASGPVGGPLGPDTTTFALTNVGVAPLAWSVSGGTPWLVTAPVAGILAPGTGVDVTTRLAPGATGLARGQYAGGITFSNLDSKVAQTVAFSLNVGGSLVQNGGFESGALTVWTLDGTGTFVPADPALVPTVYNAVKGNSSGYQVAHGGSWGMFMGDVQLATISQTLTTVPGQSYLLSFWINNPVDGFDQEFHAGWNPDGDPADPVYDLVGPGILPWTHLQWVVTASAPRTVLWLAAQNSAYGFGVDDVSVTPIPPVAIRSVARDGDVVVLGWRTAPGLPYQVQFKAALEDADWTDLGAPVIPAGDDATAVDTPDAGDAAGRFYRLVPVP